MLNTPEASVVLEKDRLEVYMLVFDLNLERPGGARNASVGGNRISHADEVLLDGPHMHTA